MIDKIARRVVEKIAMEEATMGQASGVQAAPMSGAAAETASKAEPIVQKAGPGLLRRGFNMATAPIRFAGRMATAPLRFAARHPFMAAGAGLAGAGALGLGFGHLANQGETEKNIGMETFSNQYFPKIEQNQELYNDAGNAAMAHFQSRGGRLRQGAYGLAQMGEAHGGLRDIIRGLRSGAKSLFGDATSMVSSIPRR